MSLVYLAGPLDGIEHDGTVWYDEFREATYDSNVVGFMPGRAFTGASPDTAYLIDRANRAIIETSRYVVANLSGPGRALGTIREIEFAKSRRKRVLVLGDMSSSLASHDLQTVDSLKEAADIIRDGRHVAF